MPLPCSQAGRPLGCLEAKGIRSAAPCTSTDSPTPTDSAGLCLPPTDGRESGRCHQPWELPQIWRFLSTASARSCHVGGLHESKLISVQLFIVTGSAPEET
jgi:hypothetical protein